jgi:hypothetical protein
LTSLPATAWRRFFFHNPRSLVPRTTNVKGRRASVFLQTRAHVCTLAHTQHVCVCVRAVGQFVPTMSGVGSGDHVCRRDVCCLIHTRKPPTNVRDCSFASTRPPPLQPAFNGVYGRTTGNMCLVGSCRGSESPTRCMCCHRDIRPVGFPLGRWPRRRLGRRKRRIVACHLPRPTAEYPGAASAATSATAISSNAAGLR